MIKKLMVASLSISFWFSSVSFAFAAEPSDDTVRLPGVVGKPGFWNTKSKKKLGWGWGLLLGGSAALAYGMGSKEETHTEARSVTVSCGFGCTTTQNQIVEVTEPVQNSAGVAYAGLGAGVVGVSFLISNLLNSPANIAKADSGLRVSPTYFAKAGDIAPGIAISFPFWGSKPTPPATKK